MLRNRQARSASSSVAWAVGILVCAGVVGGEISPVWAAAPSRAVGATPAAGGFAVGDGVEGFVDERSGALSFELAAGGIALAWDSRLAGVDRFGFGEGWSIGGVGSVDIRGGLRVLPASGELVEADASVPSGLSGYELGDVRFEQVPGALPARGDGVAGERAYAYRLTELGGTVSYFSAAGDPVARVDAFGNRVDWEWDERAGHRLVGVVTDSGVATTLDWSDPGRVVVSTSVGARAPVRSVVAIEHGRLGGVLDAVGRRSAVGYSEAGLVSRLAGASGAAMEVGWRAMADGSSAVDRIRVIDALTGEAITERSWQPGEGVASGWPLVPDASAGAAVDDLRYSTAVSDGATRVVSEYSGRHLLVERQVLVRDASGERVAHEQSYTYPEADGELPVTRPTHAAVTYLDALGAARTVEERFEFDDLGRVTDLTDRTGAVTERSGYDDYGVRLGGQADGETPASMLVGDVSRQPFGYAGEYTDPTGGQHLEVRTYDPETRRFQQLDPADQHNAYWYGNANPITHVDPTGRTGEPDWLAIALAGAGLMLSFIGLGVAAGTAGAAIAGAGSWAAVLTGTKVALGVTIGAAALDVGIGAALAFDQAVFDVIDDDVELGLSVATLALGAMSGATGLFARFRPPKNLREAVQKFWSNWELTAWRLRHTKDGRLKAYQHTTEEGQLVRRIHEFMSGPVLDRAKNIKGIGGGLDASTLHSGDQVVGKRVRAIKVVMVKRGAGHSDSEYLIRNSMYSNLRPQEQPYIGDPITGARLDEFMRERGITLLYIKPDPYNTAMRADWPSHPVVGQLWNRKFFQKVEGALRDARTHSRPKLNYRKDPELY
ncbi:RHS repeat-associated core domain-containing protein [Agromyces aerolatus]|uniref:RHS repeat-associated core domain-containing protein n=1 Tax=Agromyces sp. LY-1074 TaxID=3074080 RepID=UPI002855029D|nr:MULTISPECIES: RHS repeat-associated core domain-containing protein [unclassified Agromyces]MDR5701382.1 RHS repeat-associated core domain-containing protein [Agromyces sp. LY-1074]MDR5706829.1 RHS repeat-associated core domain-containing protein [Agromyces sp. LY-1358]